MESDLLKEIRKNQILWVGEVHGVKENYLIYKKLINWIRFCQVAIELPNNGEQYDDGRFSVQSNEFINWVNKHGIKLIYFDKREAVDEQQTGERKMAESLINQIGEEKTLVISGNAHYRIDELVIGGKKVVMMAALVAEKGIKMIRLGIRYAGGEFYNFGAKKFTREMYDFDKENLPFGTISKEKDGWYIHAGLATKIDLIE